MSYTPEFLEWIERLATIPGLPTELPEPEDLSETVYVGPEVHPDLHDWVKEAVMGLPGMRPLAEPEDPSETVYVGPEVHPDMQEWAKEAVMGLPGMRPLPEGAEWTKAPMEPKDLLTPRDDSPGEVWAPDGEVEAYPVAYEVHEEPVLTGGADSLW